jgi:hypothetical protein
MKAVPSTICVAERAIEQAQHKHEKAIAAAAKIKREIDATKSDIAELSRKHGELSVSRIIDGEVCDTELADVESLRTKAARRLRSLQAAEPESLARIDQAGAEIERAKQRKVEVVLPATHHVREQKAEAFKAALDTIRPALQALVATDILQNRLIGRRFEFSALPGGLPWLAHPVVKAFVEAIPSRFRPTDFVMSAIEEGATGLVAEIERDVDAAAGTSKDPESISHVAAKPQHKLIAQAYISMPSGRFLVDGGVAQDGTIRVQSISSTIKTEETFQMDDDEEVIRLIRDGHARFAGAPTLDVSPIDDLGPISTRPEVTASGPGARKFWSEGGYNEQ